MRLTDEELSAIEDQCDGFSMLVLNPSAQLDVRAMLTELRSRRAADSQRVGLSDEDKEALRVLAFLLGKHHHEPYAYEGEEIDCALALLDRLVRQ